VDEREWLASTDPQAMFSFLRDSGLLSERKARLFSGAVYRRFWPLLADEGRRAVEAAERYADGQTCGRGGLSEQRAAEEEDEFGLALWGPSGRAAAAWQPLPYHVLTPVTMDGTGEQAAQCSLCRDLFGNPFRPQTDPEAGWLTWEGGLVKKLAEAAYAERFLPSGTLDNQRLSILADALEDAGCTDAELLGHLRDPGPHYRGCWCLDGILDRE
jgi:hypothetical protein